VRVSSPIGDYDYRVERAALRGGRLEVHGRLGEWQTTTIIEPSDLLVLLRRTALPLMSVAALLAVTRWLRRV
jgi:hypothetical protein